MFKRYIRKSYIQVTIGFFVFFIFTYFYVPFELSSGFSTILSIASFLYGFYIVYSIGAAKDHHRVVIEHLKDTEGMLINIDGLMKVYNKKIQDDLKKMIDNYLIATIDYKLNDYDRSTQHAIDLMNFVQNIEPKNDKEKFAQEDSIETLETILKERVKVETTINDRITTTEWTILLVLFAVILFFILTIPANGGLLLVLLKTIVATSLLTMLIILQKYDNLTWREDRWIWDRLTKTFLQLKLDPYYPEIQYKLYVKNKKLNYDIRVVSYIDDYPDITNKEVIIIKANT